MKLLLVNNLSYAGALRSLGLQVVTLGEGEGFDVAVDGERLRLADGAAAFDSGPDLVLVELFGMRPLPVDLVDAPWPLAARVVDAPLNLYWLETCLKLFDHAFVDQPAAAKSLAEQGISASWLPLSVPAESYRELVRPPAPTRELLFVGRVGEHRPKRAQLLEHLRESGIPLRVAGGEGAAWLSPRQAALAHSEAAAGLNENLFDGLTLRMLQVMASGTPLLTERAGQGLPDLFTEGEHYVAFEPHDAAEQASGLLADEPRCRRIGEAARALVLAEHSHERRAEQLAAGLSELQGSEPKRATRNERLLAWAESLERVSLTWPRYVSRAPGLALGAVRDAIAQGATAPRARALLGRLLTRHSNGDAGLEPLRSALEDEASKLQRYLDLASYFHVRGHPESEAICLRTAVRLCNHLPEPRKQSLADSLESERLAGAEAWAAFGEELQAQGQGIWPGFGLRRDDIFPATGHGLLRRALTLDPSVQHRFAEAELLARQGMPAHAWRRYRSLLDESNATIERLLAAASSALLSYQRVQGLALAKQALSLGGEELASQLESWSLSPGERRMLHGPARGTAP